jgi:uncharacterized protein (DUF58 family)
MFFGSRRQLKSALAVRAAALLAWTTVASGERVGAVITSESGVFTLPPRSREAGALPILNMLIDKQPRAPSAVVPMTLNSALHTLAPLVHPGSLVLLLSDFAAIDAECEALLSRVAAHSECNLYWVTDQLESQPLPAGRYRGGLPNQLWMIDGENARTRWVQAWQAREQRVNSLAMRFARMLTRLDTSESATDVLRPLLQARRPAA